MSCIAELSTSWSTSSTSEYSAACRRCTTSRHRRLRLEHVGLVDAVHPVAARARRLERDARDALDLELAVVHRVVGAHARRRRRSPRPPRPSRGRASPKYRPPVSSRTMSMSTPSRNSGLSVRGVAQRVEDLDRPQVRVEPERLADAEQPLLGARLGRVGRVPLRAADGREQHRVGRVRRRRASRRAAPCRSRRSPPRRAAPRRTRTSTPWRSPMAPRTLTASAVISGPMPSPGSRQMR